MTTTIATLLQGYGSQAVQPKREYDAAWFAGMREVWRQEREDKRALREREVQQALEEAQRQVTA